MTEPKLLIPQFDPKEHRYEVAGQVVPSVTEILTAALGRNPFWTKEGRQFGTAVHTAIHYYTQGDLDYGSLHPRVKPRVDAYLKFCAEWQFRPDLVEQPLYMEQPLVCGTPDQVQFERAVVDFKCGPHLPEHALQLASYAHMLPNPLKYERLGVHLLDNGKYSLTPYRKQEAASDWNVFYWMAMKFYAETAIENWRKRYVSGRTERN